MLRTIWHTGCCKRLKMELNGTFWVVGEGIKVMCICVEIYLPRKCCFLNAGDLVITLDLRMRRNICKKLLWGEHCACNLELQNAWWMWLELCRRHSEITPLMQMVEVVSPVELVNSVLDRPLSWLFWICRRSYCANTMQSSFEWRAGEWRARRDLRFCLALEDWLPLPSSGRLKLSIWNGLQGCLWLHKFVAMKMPPLKWIFDRVDRLPGKPMFLSFQISQVEIL